ncbi:MAG: divergent polysaccharide deacetylase family protein [Pseudomonadota bacterium]
MKTGVLGGFLTGTALSALVLGGASVLTYAPVASPEAAEVAVPAGSEFRQSREDEEASLPASDTAPDAAEKPSIAAPEPDDLASIDNATESAAQPSTGEAAGGLVAPDAPDEPVGVTADVEEPVLQSPQSLAPQAPDGEADLSISTEPAQPVQPDMGESGAFEEEEQAALAPDAGEATPQIDLTEPNAPPEPEVVEPEVVAPEVVAPEVVEPDIVEPDPAPPEPEIAEPEVAEPETAEPEIAEPEIAEPEGTEPKDADPQTAEEPGVQPSGTVGNLAEGVTVGRLPSVLDAEEDTETAVEDVTPEEGPQTRLDRYSVEFENPDGKPLLSFVLLDQGDGPVSFDALAEFPYPISYAVDVTSPGAEAAMAQYRAAGLEVLAMVDLPEGSSATDAEVAMQTYLAALPETVAVMEGVGSGLQSSREAAEQLIPILQESGHGLVLFSEGLDTAKKLISREGVPALSVFRDIDGNGQSASVIRRFLDQAAFRAGQEDGGVVIVGRLRAETVSALLLWGLQDRANSVAIAPVSALLKQQVGG